MQSHNCEPGSDVFDFPKHQHAMVLVGSQHLFLVHMTNMWIGCHKYQAIFRVSIPEEAKRCWMEDRARHPTDWYIIGNTENDLMSLPNIKRGQRKSFVGSIWRSWPTTEGSEHWPWSNEPPVVGDFEVTIEEVVSFRRFDFGFNYPQTLSYILFGRGKEAHLNHYQVKQPTFDHVVSLVEAPHWLPAEGLETSMPINFPEIPEAPGGFESGQGVHCQCPLTNDTHYVQLGGHGPRRPITIERSVFFSTAVVNKHDPCTECGQ